MASSQVEFTSSPFGCALRRDHNRRSNQCTTSPFYISDENSHPQHHIDYADLWVHQPQWQNTAAATTSSPDKNDIIISNNNNDCNKSNRKVNDQNDNGKIKSQVEDKWGRAREMMLVGDGKTHDRISRRENSTMQSDTTVEMHNLGGVSSLVQKWRDFEAEAKCHSPPLCSTRSNSSTTFVENASCIDGPLRDSDICDEKPFSNEETFGDWECDRMALSGPPSSMGRDSDAAESERLKVADIIRKLTSSAEDHNERENFVGCEASTLVRTSLDQSEHNCFSPVLSSPRIRGRQAFNNLLMQMESERHKELEGLVARKTVTKFPQRGRIQALLKFRFLRRGVECRGNQHVNCTSFEFGKFMPSAIRQIRERFKSGVPNATVGFKNSHIEVGDNVASVEKKLNQLGEKMQHLDTNSSTATHKVIVVDAEASSICDETNCSAISHKVREDHIRDIETSSTYKQDEVELDNSGVDKNIQLSSHQAHGPEHLHEEASPLIDSMWQGIGYEANKHGLAKCEIVETLINVNGNEHEGEEVASNQQLTRCNNDLINDCAHPNTHCKNMQPMGIDSHCVSDDSHPEVGWEELNSNYQQAVGTNTDWISDISRPRSDWEGLRQERYCEMLDPFLKNDEIHALLERRSVSNFLSSDFRKRIDQLMMSRTQQQQLNATNNYMEETGEEHLIEENKEAKGVKYKTVALEDDDDDDDDDDKQDEERSYSDYYDEFEDESEIGPQYNDTDDCIDQFASSAPTSWFHIQGHEPTDDCYQAASPSMQPSSSSNSYAEDNRPLPSFTNPQSIEMDLIYDLRGQMKQLQREMSELRRSIKSCINMQIKLRRSIKHEAAVALSHSDQKKTKNLANESFNKGRCSICCEMSVDSLLYRCGHMCTCFNCAHELHLSGGKCPICGAQILDVVRMQSHS